MNCKKCGTIGSLTLRKKDVYCDTCFLQNTIHKFRACIGKNKISANENALICLSGGKNSTVLLDLIYNATVLDNHKKLRINPQFLHLCIGDNDYTKEILRQCKTYNFDLYIGHIADYVEPSIKLPMANCQQYVNNEKMENFNNMIKDIPPSVFNDLITKMKRNLYIKYAALLNCGLIFTAETTTNLAVKLLTNITIGRGSQIQSDIGFMDNRDGKTKIIRPMKDISQEELNNYIRIKQLTPINFNNLQENSIQSVISNFVIDLQENFQSTVSTVCKTADKIGVHSDNKNDKDNRCIMCESDLNKKHQKISALEATEFSRLVSHARPKATLLNSNGVAITEDLPDIDHLNVSMFPYIHKSLCYGCSRNYSQMNHCQLPHNIQELIQK